MEIIILSISVFLLIVTNLLQISAISNLRNKLKNSNDKLRDKDSELNTKTKILKISPGDKGIIYNYELQMGKEKPQEFKVTYEVEILEISKDKLKVKAIDYTSFDSIANDPTNKPGIIKFLENKWVDKKDVEIVIDDARRRNEKIEEVLSNEKSI